MNYNKDELINNIEDIDVIKAIIPISYTRRDYGNIIIRMPKEKFIEKYGNEKYGYELKKIKCKESPLGNNFSNKGEYIELSIDRLYKNGFEYFCEINDIDSGFDSIVFVNKKNGNIIFGVSGSDGSTLDWTYNNPRIAMGKKLPQFEAGKKFMYEVLYKYKSEIGDIRKISFTGNSLGGAISTFLAIEIMQNKEYSKLINVCLTHNSPPISASITNEYMTRENGMYNEKIFNMINEYDILNMYGFPYILDEFENKKNMHIGEIFIIKGSDEKNIDKLSFAIKAHIDLRSLENINVIGYGNKEFKKIQKIKLKEINYEIKNMIKVMIRNKINFPCNKIGVNLTYKIIEKYIEFTRNTLREYIKICLNDKSFNGVYLNIYKIQNNKELLLCESTLNGAFNIKESDLMRALLLVFGQSLIYDEMPKNKKKYFFALLIVYFNKKRIKSLIEHYKKIINNKYDIDII